VVQEVVMKRITATKFARTGRVAGSLALVLGLAACAVYEPAPVYPAYGAYPHSSSTFVFRGSFDDDRHRHRRDHHQGHHRWR
jgi:hypothetical protein